MGDPVRWGLMSTARINGAVIPGLQDSPESELVAVASRTEERAIEYAREWGIPHAHGSYEALLADPDVEVVYVSLPNGPHVEWSIRALEAGKHVLCEKPLARHPAEVERAFDAADRADRLLMEAFMWRHHPQTQRLRELVGGGAIGELRLVRATFSFTLRAEDVRLDPVLAGGSLMDVGCYSGSRLLAGEDGSPRAAVGDRRARHRARAVAGLSGSRSSRTTAIGSSRRTSAGRSADSSRLRSAAATRSARRRPSTRSTGRPRPAESRSRSGNRSLPSRGSTVAKKGVIAALVVLALAVCASSVRAATVVVVTGRGWGHGVGMSQWGARGFALHHWKWEQILAHYYPGTRLSDTANVTVRMLLAASQPGADVACAAGMRVGDATGRTYRLPAKTYNVGPGLLVHKHRLQSPIAFYCNGGPLVFDGRAYHGVLVVSSGAGRLAVVNSVDLEDYVRGVIAGEMPHRWPLAALEAQAVAARSYALATLHPRKRFDLFADDRSQVYGGMGAETPGTLYAATQTQGKILTYGGRVATTYFFSTSGGRTADVRDVWPKLGAVPYLRSVSDPYDTASPVHEWGLTLSAQLLSARLGVPFGELHVVRNSSERVTALEVGNVSLSGIQVMRLLHLRSTWFSFGELSLSGTRSSVVYGKRVALVASARGVEGAALQRLTGDHWTTLRRVRSGGRVWVEPRAYTVYRLTAGRVRGPEVGVSVAPLVTARLESSDLMSGRVLPRPTGAVTVSRYVAGGWRVVAHPRLDARGVFRTPLRLRAGGYRIDVAGDGRLAPATRTMHVTTRILASLHK